MPGRRGARAGRGWDAIPPRTGDPERSRSPRGRRWPASRAGAGGFGASTDSDPTGGDAPTTGDLTGSDLIGDGDPSGGGRLGAGAPARPRDESEVAREICLRQLAARPRTRAELAGALARKGISDEVSAEVLDRYDEVGIIDDAAFARAWVSSRHSGRGLARRALANELRQRGVDGEVAGAALDELDEETEAETARALVERKLRSSRGEPDAVFRRLVGMLARKGYPPGVAIRAVKDALAAQSAEAAEFAEQLDADAFVGADPDGDAERAFPPGR